MEEAAVAVNGFGQNAVAFHGRRDAGRGGEEIGEENFGGGVERWFAGAVAAGELHGHGKQAVARLRCAGGDRDLCGGIAFED